LHGKSKRFSSKKENFNMPDNNWQETRAVARKLLAQYVFNTSLPCKGLCLMVTKLQMGLQEGVL